MAINRIQSQTFLDSLIPKDAKNVRACLIKGREGARSDFYLERHLISTAYLTIAVVNSIFNVIRFPLRNLIFPFSKKWTQDVKDTFKSLIFIFSIAAIPVSLLLPRVTYALVSVENISHKPPHTDHPKNPDSQPSSGTSSPTSGSEPTTSSESEERVKPRSHTRKHYRVTKRDRAAEFHLQTSLLQGQVESLQRELNFSRDYLEKNDLDGALQNFMQLSDKIDKLEKELEEKNKELEQLQNPSSTKQPKTKKRFFDSIKLRLNFLNTGPIPTIAVASENEKSKKVIVLNEKGSREFTEFLKGIAQERKQKTSSLKITCLFNSDQPDSSTLLTEEELLKRASLSIADIANYFKYHATHPEESTPIAE